ncbi:MAG: hypothetical protein AB7T27_07185 [Kiritimatiellia bacterium]
MEMYELRARINGKVTVKIDSVDGDGNLIWNGSDQKWYVIWREKGANSQTPARVIELKDDLISKLTLVNNHMVLIHP